MADTPAALMKTIKEGLELSRPTFEEMNLNKLSFAKEMEYAIQIFQKNDFLAKTNSESVRNCLVNVALSGLTLNPVMKFAYLVPRKGVCCLDPSYAGLVKIVTDTGSVLSIKAGVAFEKDEFDIQLGSKGFVKHKPYLGADKPGRELGAYSIAVLNDGSEHIDFMRWDDIMYIKSRSESVRAGAMSPWNSDPIEMAKKTVIKRHWKTLPKSERALIAAQAIDIDNQVNGIDFDAEAKAKEAQQPKAATPDAPEEAMATDEDVARLHELFNDPAMPAMIFISETKPNGFSKDGTRNSLDKKNAEGQLTKSMAENYIKALEKELAKVETKEA